MEIELNAAFLELKRNKSCISDNISVVVAEDISDEIKQPFIYIINLCFREGFFLKETRNATCCNIRHNLLHLTFTLEISLFLEA